MNVAEFAKTHGLEYRTVHKHMEQGFCKWPRRHNRRDPETKQLYTWYKNIKTRCYNSKRVGYKYWGGRGIKMCTAWYVSFEQFARDIEALGPNPEGHSLDRIDNDGDYEPGNVRWADRIQQSHNSRRPGKIPGLVFCESSRLWRAHPQRNGVRVVKYFRCPIEAIIFLRGTK